MMDFSSPRVIVITGASRGIGAALASTYAAEGIVLGLVGRNEERLERTANLCREKGAQVIRVCLDVTQKDSLWTWLNDFDDINAIDLLIANAGVNSGIFPDGTQETWPEIKQVFDVNVYGTLNTVTPVIERMRAREHGQVVIISSIGAYRGLPASPAYCASKAAVKTYAEAMRDWLAPFGVGVTVVCPGYVRTDMSDRLNGAKPFLMSSTKAAEIIKSGLARNKGHIAFPKILAFGARLLGVLPDWAARRVLPYFHFTVRPDDS